MTTKSELLRKKESILKTYDIRISNDIGCLIITAENGNIIMTTEQHLTHYQVECLADQVVQDKLESEASDE